MEEQVFRDLLREVVPLALTSQLNKFPEFVENPNLLPAIAQLSQVIDRRRHNHYGTNFVVAMLTQTSSSASASASSRKTYTAEQWQGAIDGTKVSKS
jgi:hypothetical protein